MIYHESEEVETDVAKKGGPVHRPTVGDPRHNQTDSAGNHHGYKGTRTQDTVEAHLALPRSDESRNTAMGEARLFARGESLHIFYIADAIQWTTPFVIVVNVYHHWTYGCGRHTYCLYETSHLPPIAIRCGSDTWKTDLAKTSGAPFPSGSSVTPATVGGRFRRSDNSSKEGQK